MSRKVPGSTFVPVYYLEHDFDRHTHLPEAQEVYRRAVAWLWERS